MKKALYLLVILLVGCSGKPTDSEVEQQMVGNILSGGGSEIFQVENFQKVNGFEKDENTYIADVKYDLVFKTGVKDMAQQLEQKSEASPFSKLGAGLGIMALQMQYGNFEAGHRVTKEDKVTFIKTENGWRIEK